MVDEKLTTLQMHEIFLRSLGSNYLVESDPEIKPLLFHHGFPYRLYLFNLTAPPGGRTVGEHKIQLILPGHRRGEKHRVDFDRSDSRYVLLAGYSSAYEVIALWDSTMYESIAYSRNVQIRQSSVLKAFAGQISTQSKKIPKQGEEIVVAGRKEKLPELINMRRQLTLERALKL